MRRALIVLGVLLALVVGVTAVVIAVRSPGVEVEDCDAEDRRNREAECGFGPGKATKKPKATPSPKRSR